MSAIFEKLYEIWNLAPCLGAKCRAHVTRVRGQNASAQTVRYHGVSMFGEEAMWWDRKHGNFLFLGLIDKGSFEFLIVEEVQNMRTRGKIGRFSRAK